MPCFRFRFFNHILFPLHFKGLDDSGQITNKGRSPRHFSTRFEHNRELLERSTEEWKKELQK
ncbi:MAG: hypothetical protein ACI8RD_012964 [Bacillariaceae sp.]|jgi:hypothetical protein